MKLADLDYSYPSELVAQRPSSQSRIMFVENNKPCEINKQQLFEKFSSQDVLVINNTKVVKRRVYTQNNFEILFIEPLREKSRETSDELKWQVLCRASQIDSTTKLLLPDGIEIKIISAGLPQVAELSRALPQDYFSKYGEMPLPPYIQKARDQEHNVKEDETWYQAAWAEVPGSQAAPTASLHFTNEDLFFLKQKGVDVVTLTLHVGLGTFLPVRVQDLNDHKMHAEFVEISKKSWDTIKKANRVWALGTTVARSLEAQALGHLPETTTGFTGTTDLLIQEGFKFQIVDVLMTNFHQPKSTLLALVSGYAGNNSVMAAYRWAIANQFRLFSYGDLSVWRR